MTTRLPNPDTPPHWPNDLGRDLHSPTGRGALWMAHDISRWALRYVAQRGQLTAKVACLEWPAATPGRVHVVLRTMAAHGLLSVLNPDAPRHVPPIYAPGDLSDLRALQAELSELLALSCGAVPVSPTPEVPSEAQR